ncbi:MAG: Rnf-Nqr domain containing protein [Gammaproteobacteria bacterium]
MWRDNPVLTRMLGLCPLLAVSDRVVSALAMAALFACCMLWTQCLTSLTRALVPLRVRTPVQALFSATGVSLAQLLMQSYRIELANELGIYLPLLAGCCLLMVRAREFATHENFAASAWDSIHHALAVLTLILPLSLLREVLAYGSILRDCHLLWPRCEWPGVMVLPANATLPLMAMPAGALLLLAGVMALRNAAADRQPAAANERH